MGSNEKFCLRWNDFESNISIAFREIREEKDFFDCTLSVGSRQIQAHKLILSACSPFFRSILIQNPHQHPLLYLKGVEFPDLQAVLNFMYHGEVNVAQEELNSFLSVAEDLQVKGLTQGQSSKENQGYEGLKSRQVTGFQEHSKRSRPPPPTPPETKQTQRSVPHYQDVTNTTNDDIQEILPVVKSEPESTIIPYTVPVPDTNSQHIPPATVKYQSSQSEAPLPSQQLVQTVDDSYGYEIEENYDYEEYGGYEDQQSGADTSKGDATEYVEQLDLNCFKCGLCAKTFSVKSNCTRHVKINHLGEVREADTKHPCHYCGKYLVKRTIAHHVKKSCPKARENFDTM